MAEQAQFPDGFRIFAPRANAPDFVLGDIVINVDQFTQFCRAACDENGDLRLSLKRGRSGAVYAQVNTWRPQQQQQQPHPAQPQPQQQQPYPFPSDSNASQRGPGNVAYNHPPDHLPGLPPATSPTPSLWKPSTR